MLFLKTIPKALKICYKHINWVLASVGMDVVFMVLLNLVFFKTYITVILKVEEIQKLMTTNFESVAEQIGSEAIPTHILRNQEVILGLYKDIFVWVGIFIVAGFAAWVLTQTMTWFIAHKLNQKRPRFLNFLGLFSLSSFIALLIFSAGVFVTTSIINYATQVNVQFVSIQTLAFLPIVLGFIISYFLFIFYTVIPFKEPFKKFFKVAIENYNKTIPMFLIGMLLLFSIHFILILIAQIEPVLTLVGIVVLLLPYLAFMRIYFCLTIKSLLN